MKNDLDDSKSFFIVIGQRKRYFWKTMDGVEPVGKRMKRRRCRHEDGASHLMKRSRPRFFHSLISSLAAVASQLSRLHSFISPAGGDFIEKSIAKAMLFSCERLPKRSRIEVRKTKSSAHSQFDKLEFSLLFLGEML